MKKFSLKRKIAAAGAVAAIVVGAGVSYAYFTSTGSGSGSATTGSSTNLTIAQDAFGNGVGQQPAVTLYPGTGIQGINFTVSNPGAGHEYVNTVTASVAANAGNALNASDSTPIPGCLASWYQVNNPTQTVGQDIAGGSSYDFTGGSLSVQLTNPNVSQDACQGKTVKLSFTSN
jgi:hypothetical protein